VLIPNSATGVVYFPAGAGASSILGGGAPAQYISAGAANGGQNASYYGGGGSGALATFVLNTSLKGGNGSPGIVIITEFCRQ
jgi:hypothetical protein